MQVFGTFYCHCHDQPVELKHEDFKLTIDKNVLNIWDKLFPALKSEIFLQIFPPDVSSRHKTTKRLGTSMSIFGRMVIRVSSAVYAPFSGTLLTVLAVLCCYMTVCKTKIVGQLWMESQPILRSGPSTRSLRRYVISTMKTWLRNSQVCFDLVHLSFVKRSLKR